MAKEVKELKMSDMDKSIYGVLKDAAEPMTLAAINEKLNGAVKTGHITSAKKKGYLIDVGEMEVERPAEKEVNAYRFVTEDKGVNAKGETCDYSPIQKKLIAAAQNFDDAFTAADLEKALGKKVPVANVTALVNKGNFEKLDEKVKVPTVKKSKVKTYALVEDFYFDFDKYFG